MGSLEEGLIHATFSQSLRLPVLFMLSLHPYWCLHLELVITIQDVIDIASGPEYVTSAQSFSQSQFDCVQTIQEDDICHSGKLVLHPSLGMLTVCT